MSRRPFAVLCVGLAFGSGALAADLPALDDSHLDIVPFTASETERVAKILQPPTDFSKPQPFEALPGGAATYKGELTRQSFSMPSANMPFDRRASFSIGNGFFQKLWVTSPSSTLGSDGLGPLYNSRSCQRCHLMDGRGHPPNGPEDDSVSLILLLSQPGGDPIAEIPDYIATRPDPVYGSQLQEFAAPGQRAEIKLDLAYESVDVPLAGAEVAHLRRPTFTPHDFGYGPLDPASVFSPRVAPPMIGMGLLEAIPAQTILAAADPDDADGDGVSGRPNIVWSLEFGKPMLGRFGWKAGQPTVREQSAGAFSNDMGISSPIHPANWGDCTEEQSDCRTAPQGAVPPLTEIEAAAFDDVAFYSRNLAVPRRRGEDSPQVLRGKKVFYDAGCQSCHTPSYVTHRLKGQPEQSFQLIWPYTDLLLHDMGPDLADGRAESRATGSEWRTPPLWGIGLTGLVSDQIALLHDGRARTVLEAVLWHGGEAQAARDHVVALSPSDRADLVAFLESL